MRWLWYSFLALFSLGMLTLIAGVGLGIYAISYFSRDLPDYTQLKDFQPQEVTRVYAGDGRLMAEFAQEKRVFVPIDAIPPLIKNAFISAEDKNFYHHQGVDFSAVARAAILDLRNRGKGKRPEGASTITQQVAKNFLLTNEVSFKRKIREAILAFRMERAMSKDRILELYLNQIFLGEGAYGVAAAAETYFNKPLEDLNVQEAAYLAVLPKAPNNYDPVHHKEAALARRNWVIGQMADNGYVTKADASAAEAAPLTAMGHSDANIVTAPYFAEEVRRQLVDKYGDASLYGGGLVVRTSVDPRLQAIAEKALRAGLMGYDMRHGWRGPLGHVQHMSEWQKELAAFKVPPSMLDSWRLAAVLHAAAADATVGLADGSEAHLLVKDLAWAKHETAPVITETSQVLHSGDIVMVEETDVTEPLKANAKPDAKPVVRKAWLLRQIPRVNGAMVAMDPHTGRVLAMQGGWSFHESEFNRATQAWRQPGSSFKPFVYLTALEKGFTPSTLVLDGPIVINPGPGQKVWAPTNYKGELFGPVPLRVGIEKSLNLVTIRVANFIGMSGVVDTAVKFGVVDKMEPMLSNAIGAQVTTVMRMVTAYSEFVNGGKKLSPTLIDRIEDRNGKTIFSFDKRPCAGCGPLIPWSNQVTPTIPDAREQLADPKYIYQIVSMLQGVVQRGTGRELGKLGRPLAGKTGTTNDSKDTWFMGFSPDLAAGVYIGYDNPKTLGKHETGATVAVPVFYQFMQQALADTPPTPFRVPPGIRQVLVNADNGALAKPGDQNTIWESFIAGTEPGDNKSYILDTAGISELPSGGASEGDNSSDEGNAGNDNSTGPDFNAAYSGATPPAGSDSGSGAGTGTGGLY